MVCQIVNIALKTGITVLSFGKYCFVVLGALKQDLVDLQHNAQPKTAKQLHTLFFNTPGLENKFLFNFLRPQARKLQ